MTERFYVTELTGFWSPGMRATYSKPGTSFTIHDRAFLCRRVWTLRTEDVGKANGRGEFSGEARAVEARRRAEQRCHELNDA